MLHESFLFPDVKQMVETDPRALPRIHSYRSRWYSEWGAAMVLSLQIQLFKRFLNKLNFCTVLQISPPNRRHGLSFFQTISLLVHFHKMPKRQVITKSLSCLWKYILSNGPIKLAINLIWLSVVCHQNSKFDVQILFPQCVTTSSH